MQKPEQVQAGAVDKPSLKSELWLLALVLFLLVWSGLARLTESPKSPSLVAETRGVNAETTALSPISMAQFGRLRVGMTRSEVERTVGRPGDFTHRPERFAPIGRVWVGIRQPAPESVDFGEYKDDGMVGAVFYDTKGRVVDVIYGIRAERKDMARHPRHRFREPQPQPAAE